MTEAGNQLDESEKQYGEKVDIDELLPKDKHRIITNLYTKLALASSKWPDLNFLLINKSYWLTKRNFVFCLI